MGTSIGIANAIGFNKPKGGVKIPQWFKDSLVCWYNPKKQGLTNDKIEKGKPFLLKDFSKNKLDMTMNNFDGEGMSGMGGWATDLKKMGINTTGDSTVITVTSLLYAIKVRMNLNINNNLFFFRPGSKIFSLKSNVQFRLVNTETDETFDIVANTPTIIKSSKVSSSTIFYFYTKKELNIDDIVTIEQLPLYPDALVFDGVDDYGISENQPILTDYTVIAKRKIENKPNNWNPLASRAAKDYSKRGAFVFECREGLTPDATYSFGNRNEIQYQTEDVSFQTAYQYNNQSIVRGTQGDTGILLLGSYSEGAHSYFKGALYEFFLFNRTLTQDEIDFVKYVVMKEDLPEPIAVYDAKGRTNEDADRDILPNLAPNGNHDYDIKLHNFAWTQESGYNNTNYKGGLVFDGVDDYGVNENMPIFTPEKGYTVIAERKWINPKLHTYNNFIEFLSNTGRESIVCERRATLGTDYRTYNFAVETWNLKYPNLITYQTSKIYNGQNIKIGDILPSGKLKICNSGNIVLYKLHLFDHDLTPKEIEMYIQKKIDKKYKLPIVEQSKE